MAVEAHCFKCKVKREMVDPEQVTLSNGRAATKGTCGECGGKLSRMGHAKPD